MGEHQEEEEELVYFSTLHVEVDSLMMIRCNSAGLGAGHIRN